MINKLTMLAAMLFILWLSTPTNNKAVNTTIKSWATAGFVFGFAVGAFV